MYKTQEEFETAVKNLNSKNDKAEHDLFFNANGDSTKTYVADLDYFTDKRNFIYGLSGYLNNESLDNYKEDPENESKKIEALSSLQEDLDVNGLSLAGDFAAREINLDSEELQPVIEALQNDKNIDEDDLNYLVRTAKVDKYIQGVVEDYELKKDQEQFLEEDPKTQVDPNLAAQYLNQQGLDR